MGRVWRRDKRPNPSFSDVQVGWLTLLRLDELYFEMSCSPCNFLTCSFYCIEVDFSMSASQRQVDISGRLCT